jgi:hypothetical protein
MWCEDIRIDHILEIFVELPKQETLRQRSLGIFYEFNLIFLLIERTVMR